MQKILRLVALLLAVATPAVLVAQRFVEIDVLVDKNTIPVRVSSSTPELNTLALLAFVISTRTCVAPAGAKRMS